jgi:hypothetical protein
MKNLIARHELDLNGLKNKIEEMTGLFMDITKGKVYEDIKKKLSTKPQITGINILIGEIIDSNSESLNETLKNKLQSKAEFNVVENFIQNLDTKIFTSLNTKIDKIELRRAQAQLRKKVNQTNKQSSILSLSMNAVFEIIIF